MHFAAVFGTEDCLTVLLNVSAPVNVQVSFFPNLLAKFVFALILHANNNCAASELLVLCICVCVYCCCSV